MKISLSIGTAREYYPIIAKTLLIIVALFSFLGTIVSAQATAINTAICKVYGEAYTAVFLLGVTLMILGAAMYAGAHLLPGSQKGSLQGYGMGMLIGGLIGIILAMLGPYIVGLISPSTASTCSASGTVTSLPTS